MMRALTKRPRISELGVQLYMLGLREAALADLSRIARLSRSRRLRSHASFELAVWHLFGAVPPDPAASLHWLKQARAGRVRPKDERPLAILQMLAHHAAGDLDAARSVYDAAGVAGLVNPDFRLSATCLCADPAARLDQINAVLTHYDLSPVTLHEQPGVPAFDRLQCAESAPARTDGPLVSVIVAAYQAGQTLATALRSLQAQSWANLEVLVVDDASPSDQVARCVAAFSASDPRFRLIRLDQNGGAYVARNCGLDQARGEFVTLHDADDWSHPAKLRAQAEFLLARPEAIACLSEQARATEDLCFPRWSGNGRMIKLNYSSLMFRRDPVRARLGYWDTVRFGADSEMLTRLHAAFGRRAVVQMETGPLSFTRTANDNATSDAVLGIGLRHHYGARLDYSEAHALNRANGAPLLYQADPARRPFPAPAAMRSDRARIAVQDARFDLIIAADFRAGSPMAAGALDDALHAVASGARVAVMPLFRYLGATSRDTRPIIAGPTRMALNAQGVRILCYGDQVRCDGLVMHDPAALVHRQSYLPQVAPAHICGVVAAPWWHRSPSDLLLVADERASSLFGLAPEWFAQDATTLRRLRGCRGADSWKARLSPLLWSQIRTDRLVPVARPAPVVQDAGRGLA